MPQRELPENPNLEHLKNQAKQLLQQRLGNDDGAVARMQAAGITNAAPKLADALHTIAREYGFATWPKLKFAVESASEDPMQALGAAVKSDSADLVRKVLQRYPSLKSRIDEPVPALSFDTPALIAAVHRNNREMVDVLLNAGANVNQRSQWWAGGFGVLDMANADLAEYLISRGAVVDIHAASRLGKLDRVRELLDADPHLVHARGGDGQTPLHVAATVEIAALLLDREAEIDVRDIDHESTSAQYAVCQRQDLAWREPYRHDVARFLLSRGAAPDLFMASALGDLALVEQILNHDPETVRMSINERHFPKNDPKSGGHIYFSGFGITKTPHMVARDFGHQAVSDLLMQRSAPWLRLAEAAEMRDEALVLRIMAAHPMLIRKLSAPASRKIVGLAVRNNNRGVELLLSCGWPAGAPLENNQTALHYAAWHGNVQMVRELLRHNAPVNVFETEHGGSPLAWALHGSGSSWHRETGDYPAVVETLLAAGAQIPTPEHMPLAGAEDALEVIRRHSASVTVSGPAAG